MSRVMGDAETAVHRDLKLNLQKILEGQSALSVEEANLSLLALATSLGDQSLQALARERLAHLSAEELREAAESAAIMGMLNTYYKFRYMIKSAQGPEAEAKYQRASLRMNSLSKPVLGAVRFEMLALTVSVLNGCESCITAHEKVLLEHQVESEKIHDLARLAAIVKGAHTLELV